MAADELSHEVKPRTRRRRKAFIAIGVLLCLVIAAFIVARVRAGGAASVAARDAGADEVYAAVANVKRQTVADSLSIAGQFMPYQNVELHAKVAGYIKNIYVDIGDRVHTGQVLAVLEIPELVAQVDASKAEVHHAEEEIQRAKSDVLRAQADNVALHANAQRLVNTDKVRPGLIAEQELDDATAKDRASQAQVDAAKSALAAAQQQLAVAKADQQHYAALEDYARITAPYDGVVTWRFSDTGALVQAGTSNTSGLPVVTVAQVNVLRLRIPVPESLAGKVRIRDAADVHVQATGEHFTGKVTRFTGALDPSTRTMQVEIDVPNPNYHLQPGMYADVTLLANSRPDALTIPITAVLRSDNKTSVLVVDSQDRVQVRPVVLGVETPNRAEVLSGLNEGERVIIGNLGAYQAGELVKAKRADFTAVGKLSGAE
ncbi:MAG TPA: efflux RND transporter periplasmic adaptor subunit [Terriglobales bacterium]|nr:efflux RND transporter periplasmic adaptor subunit [Terriglobales bacterium]